MMQSTLLSDPRFGSCLNRMHFGESDLMFFAIFLVKIQI